MRPGISKISEGPGVRERVLVKVGFNYWLNISKSSDTFWGGLSKAGGKGEMREQGRNMCAIGKGQQGGPLVFLTLFLHHPRPPLPPCCTQLTLSLLHRDVGLQLVMSECPFCWLMGCSIFMVGSCAAEMVLFRLGPDQNVVPTPISRGLLPSSPLLSHPPVVGQGQRGWEGN